MTIYVSKILRKRNIVLRKRKPAPKYCQKKLNSQRRQIRNLRETVFKPTSSIEIVMDDE